MGCGAAASAHFLFVFSAQKVKESLAVAAAAPYAEPFPAVLRYDNTLKSVRTHLQTEVRKISRKRAETAAFTTAARTRISSSFDRANEAEDGMWRYTKMSCEQTMRPAKSGGTRQREVNLVDFGESAASCHVLIKKQKIFRHTGPLHEASNCAGMSAR